MDRQQRIKKILRGWECVPRIRAKSVVVLSGEDMRDIVDHCNSSRREEDLEELLLCDEGAFRAADFLRVEEDADMDYSGFVADDDAEATEERQRDARVKLCMQLVDLDAVDKAIELLGALTIERDEGVESDHCSIVYVVERLVQALSEQGRQTIAWRLVDGPLFEYFYQGVGIALIIPSVTKSPIDLARAQRIVEREAEKFWNHPEYGTSLRTNAVHYWMDLWSVSRCDEDLRRTRELCRRLGPFQRSKGWMAVAYKTWAQDDIISAFDAARLIRNGRLRAEMVRKIISRLEMSVIEACAMMARDPEACSAAETKRFADFLETVRRVADLIPNQRWRSLLLEKMTAASSWSSAQ